MTIENTIARYKNLVATGNTKEAEKLMAHMTNPKSRKYRDNPLFLELTKPKKEVKKDGKKSKG